MDKAAPKQLDRGEHLRSLGPVPRSSDPNDDQGVDDQSAVGSSADPGQDETFAFAVEQHLRRLAHDHMIDEIAAAARREPRGLKGARRQFRRIGLPRCIVCHTGWSCPGSSGWPNGKNGPSTTPATIWAWRATRGKRLQTRRPRAEITSADTSAAASVAGDPRSPPQPLPPESARAIRRRFWPSD